MKKKEGLEKMGTQHIDIPPLVSPLTVCILVLWICLVGGISLVWSGTRASNSKAENGGRDISLGMMLIGVYILGYWFLYQVFPYLAAAGRAVLK